MALVNFTLAASAATGPTLAPVNSTPLRVQLDDLLYSPEGHQNNDAPQVNEPFLPPTRRSRLRKRTGPTYLPPQNQFTRYQSNENIPFNPYTNYNHHPEYDQIHTQVYNQQQRLDVQIENQRVHELPQRVDNSGQYIHDPAGDYDYGGKNLNQEPRYYPSEPDYDSKINQPQKVPVPHLRYPLTSPSPPTTSQRFNGPHVNNFNFVSGFSTPAPTQPRTHLGPETKTGATGGFSGQTTPDRPRGFTKVETGSSGAGSKTQIHAILDYDDDGDDYDDVLHSGVAQPAVTPLQGPILLRNGSVPVVPLTSYNTVNNGSYYQIPILWTALSLALGYEVQSQIVKGVPCVKRNFQLYCPTAGNTYPLDKIENFIDENKALIKRMYGSFATPGGSRVRRAPGVPDLHSGDSYFRHTRQAANVNLPDSQSVNNTGRLDACESKTEIMTPYWALNSARKLRAIVNTMHFEQAIHQEVCSKTSTSRCSGDCGCEQKYKWHRLLAYDPNDDCAGIFMDWFLFPSCCVCRCNP